MKENRIRRNQSIQINLIKIILLKNEYILEYIEPLSFLHIANILYS